jgi:hypothetical protein
VPTAVDAGVVDHRVDLAEPVDLVGHSPGLVQVGEVPDDGRRALDVEVVHGGQLRLPDPIRRPSR